MIGHRDTNAISRRRTSSTGHSAWSRTGPRSNDPPNRGRWRGRYARLRRKSARPATTVARESAFSSLRRSFPHGRGRRGPALPVASCRALPRLAATSGRSAPSAAGCSPRAALRLQRRRSCGRTPVRRDARSVQDDREAAGQRPWLQPVRVVLSEQVSGTVVVNEMWESITPPLVAVPGYRTSPPVSSGSPLSTQGPKGVDARASPIARAFDFWRAVKAVQYSSPTFAISGAQKSATRFPVAAHSGARPSGKMNPRCSNALSRWSAGSERRRPHRWSSR